MRKRHLSAAVTVFLLFAMLLGCVGCAAPQTDSTTTGNAGGNTTIGDAGSTTVGGNTTAGGNPTTGNAGDNPTTKPMEPPVEAPKEIRDGFYGGQVYLDADNKVNKIGYRFEGNQYSKISQYGVDLSGEYELTDDGQIIFHYIDWEGNPATDTKEIVITDTSIELIGPYVSSHYYFDDPNTDYTGTILDGIYTTTGTLAGLGYVFEGNAVYGLFSGSLIDTYKDYQIIGNWIFFQEDDGDWAYGKIFTKDGDDVTFNDVKITVLKSFGSESAEYDPSYVYDSSKLDGRYFEVQDSSTGRTAGYLFKGDKMYAMQNREVKSTAVYEIDGHLIHLRPLDDNFETTDPETHFIFMGDGYFIIDGLLLYLTEFDGELPY